MIRRLTFSLVLLLATALSPAATVVVERSDRCNLFAEGAPVVFRASVDGMPTGNATAVATVTDYAGTVAKTVDVPVKVERGKKCAFGIDLGVLPPGYYELTVKLSMAGQDGKTVVADSTVRVQRVINPGNKPFPDVDPISFGVVQFVTRSAAEARSGDYRFGLKIFQIGSPGVWWRKGTVYDLKSVVNATTLLGLQWTRHQFNQPPNTEPGVIGTRELTDNYPMNVVLKIEGFPEDCFDIARYGTIEEWKAKNPKKIWSRCTVPKKEQYQAWLAIEIGKIPPEQNVFEIGNEVWDYMSPQEFAEWTRMTCEVVKRVRPDAKIGADPGGRAEFADAFMEAGGMDGMDIIYCHPYCFTPLPEHRVRPLLRNLREKVAQATGKQMDVYVTEYGWPTAAHDTRKHSVSEAIQAQRTARQSILMYAEDVKALIPHWMADREQDVAERENWFGFFRLSGQPKPVLIAHAACARMIDGSRFAGDLWVNGRVGALLFERGGTHTLALWSLETPTDVEIDVAVPQVKVVDLMGRERLEPTPGGKFRAKLDGSVIYLVGVDPSLAKRVSPPDHELNPEQWAQRPTQSLTMSHASATIEIDGRLDEWDASKPATFRHAETGATGRLTWDDRFVYVAVTSPTKDGVFKVGLSGKPERQQDTASLYDRVLSIQPSQTGAKLTVVGSTNTGKSYDLKSSDDPTGVRGALQVTDGGWTGELAIPLSYLKGFPEPKPGVRVSGRLGYEHDKKNFGTSDESPRKWSFLVLEK